VCGGGYPCGDNWTGCGYPCRNTCHGVGIPAEIHVTGVGIPAEIHFTGVGIPAEIHRIHWIEIMGLYTPEKCRSLSFVAVCSLVYHF
jgi:hypothetical protein